MNDFTSPCQCFPNVSEEKSHGMSHFLSLDFVICSYFPGWTRVVVSDGWFVHTTFSKLKLSGLENPDKI